MIFWSVSTVLTDILIVWIGLSGSNIKDWLLYPVKDRESVPISSIKLSGNKDVSWTLSSPSIGAIWTLSKL